MPSPIPDEPLSERELEWLEDLDGRAVAAPWWDDEDDHYYRLHGTAGWTPRQRSVPPQVVNHQILKAPKKSEIFEPYWPNRADAELIIRMRNALPRMIKELRELREAVHTCSCADGVEDGYEGPRAECPVHGVVQALKEAQAELKDVRARYLKLRTTMRDALGPEQADG